MYHEGTEGGRSRSQWRLQVGEWPSSVRLCPCCAGSSVRPSASQNAESADGSGGHECDGGGGDDDGDSSAKQHNRRPKAHCARRQRGCSLEARAAAHAPAATFKKARLPSLRPRRGSGQQRPLLQATPGQRPSSAPFGSPRVACLQVERPKCLLVGQAPALLTAIDLALDNGAHSQVDRLQMQCHELVHFLFQCRKSPRLSRLLDAHICMSFCHLPATKASLLAEAVAPGECESACGACCALTRGRGRERDYLIGPIRPRSLCLCLCPCHLGHLTRLPLSIHNFADAQNYHSRAQGCAPTWTVIYGPQLRL